MRKLVYILLIAALAGCGKTPAVNGAASPDAVAEAEAFNQKAAETEAVLPENPANASNASETISGEPVNGEAEKEADEYFFIYDNVEIRINTRADETLLALGEYQDYFEAPSCAFDGLDKTYYYNGFEITTYPNGNEDYIFSVSLADDNNKTPEGLYLGASVNDIIAAYGEDYEKDMGLYVYEKGGTKLLLLTENDIVVSITYEMALEE